MLSMQAFFGERFVFACLSEEDTTWIKSAASAVGIKDAVTYARLAPSRGQAETAFDAISLADPGEPLWIYNIDTHVAPMAMRPRSKAMISFAATALAWATARSSDRTP